MEVGPNGGKMGEPSRNFIAWLSQPLRLLLELFSLTFLSLDILFWWCRFLLIWFVLDMFESWQSFRLPVDSEARNLRHPSLLTIFLRSSLNQKTPMSCKEPLSVDVSFSWQSYLLASFGILGLSDLLLLTFPSLDIPFSWNVFLFWHLCFCILFFYILFVWNLFLLKLLSLQTFCLVLRLFFILHSHVFFLASFPHGIPLFKVRPSITLYYKACTKHSPVLLCITNLAQRTSQHYFVLQSLHKHFPVLLCTSLYILCATKLAESTLQ